MWVVQIPMLLLRNKHVYNGRLLPIQGSIRLKALEAIRCTLAIHVFEVSYQLRF